MRSTERFAETCEIVTYGVCGAVRDLRDICNAVVSAYQFQDQKLLIAFEYVQWPPANRMRRTMYGL